MRFFWTGNFRDVKPIQIAILFFIFFILLFWFGNFFHFGLKYGYSIKSIEYFYFGDEEFTFEIPQAQLTEETHINLFIVSLLFLCISALMGYNGFSNRFKIVWIAFLFIVSLLYAISDYLVIFSGRKFAFLKLILFLLFQISVFLSLLFSFRKNSQNGSRKILAVIIFLFAITNLFFVAINFHLYLNKIGLGINNIAEYYLGNQAKFIKPKSLTGLIQISYFHFLAMALYLMTLSHFLFLMNDKFNISITLLLFFFALTDNLSGILIVLIGISFSIVKLISFLLFQILLIVTSGIIISRLIKLKFSFSNNNR